VSYGYDLCGNAALQVQVSRRCDLAHRLGLDDQLAAPLCEWAGDDDPRRRRPATAAYPKRLGQKARQPCSLRETRHAGGGAIAAAGMSVSS
jgi:hypothetical protein